jgi:hypothetical protein
LTEEEQRMLQHLARSGSAPAEQVARAKALLVVAEGGTYTEAARHAGRHSNDAVSQLAGRFNRAGVQALVRRPGQGAKRRYTARERARILEAVKRAPTPAQDGTATWSLMSLRRALRQAPDGLPRVSTYTIRAVLQEAGYRWLGSRSWCETGQVVRRRKRGLVRVSDPDAEAKKT